MQDRLTETKRAEPAGHEGRRRRSWVLPVAGGVVAATVAVFCGRALRDGFAARHAGGVAEVCPKDAPVGPTNALAAAERLGRGVVRVNPAGAVVRVGGLAYGPAPLTIDALPVGRHRVVVTHPGYFEWKGEIEVLESAEAVLSVDLLRSYGDIAVTTDPPGLGFELVGDGFTQKGKGDGRPLRVPTGRYELTVRRPRHPQQRRVVEVRHDAPTVERFALVGGRIEIDSIPAGATVFERSVVLGKTPYAADGVPSGEHRFELRLKDFGVVECVVPVEEGGCVRKSVVLTKFAGPLEGVPWRIPGLDLDLVWLRAALVTVGSPGAVNADTMEASLSTGFWLGATEVTQRQWQSLMPSNPSRVKGDDLPVDRVAWDEAMEFCRNLTAREAEAGRLPEGYEYTLPSEVQWEYACWAGMGRIDERQLDRYAWYRTNSGGKPHPVRMKKANAWGFYDMLGNVAELCRDAYRESRPKKAPDYLAVPESQDERRTYRGGHCDEYGLGVNAYQRYGLESRRGWANVGFRLALVRKVEDRPKPTP